MSWARAHRRWLLWAAVATIAVLAFVFRDEFPEFSLETIIEDLSKGLGSWTYLLVGALAFLETGAFVGLVAPGEFTVLLGGAVAGQGQISLPLILGITWLAAYLGDTVSFMLGRRLGRAFLVRHGERVRITEPRLRQVEDYFDRHGGKTILIGRFIGLVRALAPFIAGSSGMRYGAFAPYSVLGTGIWATLLILAGYFFSTQLHVVAEIVGTGLIAFGIAVGVVIAVVLLARYLRVPANRSRVVGEMERRPGLRQLVALGRRLKPQARFLWNRLTPGGLGLELTTLLAVLSVAAFVLYAYWSVVAGDPGPTPGDETAFDVVEGLRAAWLDDLAEVVTRLGSGPVLWLVALVAGIALGLRGRWIELGVLAAGVVTTVVTVDLIKEWVDRPRPANGLVSVDSSSFPSGHAAYSVIYAWLGVTIALRVVPGLTRRTLVIVAGIAVTALVGLTRVYLGVHYLSDVSAGWALGVAAFTTAAMVALVATHIVDNHEPDDRDRD